MSVSLTSEGNAAIDFGSIYEEHVALLVGTAVEHFRICETDAEALAHEVLVAISSKRARSCIPKRGC